jgi:hypothetical protein
MKYKIINNKGYNIFYGRFEILPGINEITCTDYEAEILSSSNGLLVEKVKKEETKDIKKRGNINLLKE